MAENTEPISADLMQQYDTHLEKTHKSSEDQHPVNNGAMIELQERGIRAYEGLGISPH